MNRHVLGIASLLWLAAACSNLDTQQERALSGGAMGAGGGVVVGAFAGGPVGTIVGAIVGGGAGAGTGALTTKEQVSIGNPASRTSSAPAASNGAPRASTERPLR